MQKVLVTGANGFVGHYLVQQLLQKGFQVIATGKGASRLPFTNSNLIWETLDFTNHEEVRITFDHHRPDAVVHCGAMSKPDECETNREAAFLTNVSGTLHLMEAAKTHRSFFVFLSTDFVFSGEKGMYREDDERSPVNYYGETKMLAEDEVKKYSFGWSIVRTVLVYGKPFQSRDNILTRTVSALQKGETLKIFDDQVRTPTYVEDLAGAIVTIVEQRATGIYHISGEDVLTPYEMAVAAAKFVALDASKIEKVTEQDMQQPARRPLKTGFDISKAKKELGYKAVSFEEGLKRTFA